MIQLSPSLRQLAQVAILFLCSTTTTAYFPVPFQINRYYGYDGPWQAITAQVGGFDNGTIASAQWTSVDLMPGGFWETYILADDLCTGKGSACGEGGTWDPGNNQTQDGDSIAFEPSYDDPLASGLYMVGEVYAQNLNIGGTNTPSYTVPNATLVAVMDGNITLPDGSKTPLEIGTFGLGANDQNQNFGYETTNASVLPISTWMFPAYLYNTSTTKSYSYAIHIGSAAFDYPGSLMFGGYDKGRAIGPATTWGDTPPQLLDIVLGVETGGSPFTKFNSSMSGLLLDNTSTHNQLPVFPEPLAPYLHLPNDTCNKLAEYLPVYYDSSNGYYLWNTSDPSYSNITSSAAYLGFVFPPATGGTEDVTIKVPFALLNLTLEQPASGMAGKMPYFPCRSYTPPGSGPAAGGSGDNSYLLGRAFLQAAFVGRNWNQHVSWLAQAPGPGPSKQGLGYEPQDIQDTDTTLDLYDGDNYFNQSWTGYWTPLAGATPSQPAGVSNSTNATTSTTSTHIGTTSDGLSTGAKAGIGIGAAAVGVLALALGAFLFMRRRKKEHTPSESEPFVAYPHDQKPAPPYSSGVPIDGQQQQPYNQSYRDTAYVPYKSDPPAQHGPPIQLSELPQNWREPSELPGVQDSPREMDAPRLRTPEEEGARGEHETS